ncbi:MAG: toll/interleukin-1 receptor domain-containing protein [Gemmatimonadaceae bacterium]|nr:toll/interleukin-1 receptor domain-containing protein [Gemmatimonadaceae bacterium]
MTTAHRIFLSYRRGDTAGHVGRLYDALVKAFGKAHVFMDIDGLAPGEDFALGLAAQLRDAAVVLVVIGPRWAGVGPDGHRRLDAPGDFVRLEVATALQRPDALVIPVLCEGVTMPSAESLPDNIAPLARRNAIVLSDLRWTHDVEQLIGTIERHVVPQLASDGGLLRQIPPKAWLAAAAALVLLLWRPWQPATPSLPAGMMPSGSMPKAVDHTPPARVLPDGKSQIRKAQKDWARDAELVYLGVDCQANWTGCYVMITLRSESQAATLSAIRDASGGNWTYQSGQYEPRYHAVQVNSVDLDVAMRAARAGGMVGPIDRANLDGPRPDLGRRDGQWVIQPSNTDASGRVRFCVNARSGRLEDC